MIFQMIFYKKINIFFTSQGLKIDLEIFFYFINFIELIYNGAID